MSMHRAFSIGAAGLSAQRVRVETLASNLVNARSTRTAEGGPYQRRSPVFSAEPVATSFADTLGRALRTVRVDRIVADQSPPLLRFEPGHPDADAAGFVAYPDINPIKEMTDLISASRSYEASVTVIKGVREMGSAALQILS